MPTSQSLIKGTIRTSRHLVFFPWICAYRYSLRPDASICEPTLFKDLIHVSDKPVLLDITNHSIHKRLQTTQVQLA